jgi:Ner family transcriptional regulator
MDDSDDIGQDPKTPSDWHPADVQAALKKRGLSLAGLSTVNGYHATAAGKALKRPWPALEVLIAKAIGVPPQDIWPSRYNSKETVSVPKIDTIKKN